MGNPKHKVILEQVLQYECSMCKAPVGEECKTKKGIVADAHRDRVKKALDYLKGPGARVEFISVDRFMSMQSTAPR